MLRPFLNLPSRPEAGHFGTDAPNQNLPLPCLVAGDVGEGFAKSQPERKLQVLEFGLVAVPPALPCFSAL